LEVLSLVANHDPTIHTDTLFHGLQLKRLHGILIDAVEATAPPFMSTLALAMASPSSLKRTYAEAGLEDVLPAPAPSSPFCALTTPSPTPNSATQDKIFSQNVPASSVSPALMSIPTGTPVSMPNGCVSATGTPITPTQQPTKKSKLTFEEKEIKRIEKEFKDRERAEERARKEAEKAKKEGKKSKKDEEKAKKEAEKEAEKTKREEEKKLREAEKEDRRIKKEETTRLKHEEKAKRDVEKAEKEEEKNKKASVRSHGYRNTAKSLILTYL